MLKMIFAFVGLLIAVAVVSQLGKSQMQLVSGSTQSATRVMDAGADVDAAAKAARNTGDRAGRMDAFPGAVAAEPLNVQQQSINVQNQVRDKVQQNLQQGMNRSSNAQQ